MAQWVDERLENIAGMEGAEDPTPEEQTVDILPVIHRLICVLQNTNNHGHCLISGVDDG